MAVGEAAVGVVVAGEASVCEIAAGEAAVGVVVAGEASVCEIAAGEAAVSVVVAGEASTCDVVVGDSVDFIGKWSSDSEDMSPPGLDIVVDEVRNAKCVIWEIQKLTSYIRLIL